MRVLAKMAVDTVHPLLEMNVVQVDCLLKAIRIVGRDDTVPGIQQVTFPVAFEYLAEHPTMPVKIGKLGASQLRIEFGRSGLVKKRRVRPASTHTGRLRVIVELALLFGLRWIVLLSRIHLVAVCFVVPPRQA